MKGRILVILTSFLCIVAPAVAQLPPLGEAPKPTPSTTAPASMSVEAVNADLKTARAANAEKRYADAEALMLKDTAAKPNLPYPWIELGNAQLGLKKYDEAEQEFSTALDLDPNVLTQQSSLGSVIRARGTDYQFYYYMAKAFASKGRAEEAVRYLRHAFEDGYKDMKKIDEDPDFQKISHYPAYVELMKNPPVAIKD